jgi:hypothetical protein
MLNQSKSHVSFSRKETFISLSHRVAAADEEGYVSAYTLSPCAIYGQAPAPIPRVSLLTSWMLQMAPAFKGVPFVGEGTNVTNYVRASLLLLGFILTTRIGPYQGRSICILDSDQVCTIRSRQAGWVREILFRGGSRNPKAYHLEYVYGLVP